MDCKTRLQENRSMVWPLAVNVLLVQSMLMIDILLVAPLGEMPVAMRTVYFIFVLKLDSRVDLRYPQERPFFAEMRPQLSEILPIATNFFVLFIGASIYQLLFSQLELASFVAISLIFPWLRIGTQFVSAWAQASAISISQAIGHGETQHLKTFVSACTGTALVLSFGVALLFFYSVNSYI